MSTKKVKADWNRENDTSILETYNIVTGERKVLKEFPFLIEAPNWSLDGKFLVYNSKGRIYKYILETGETEEVYTGEAIACNNDHVLAADGSGVAVSHMVKDDSPVAFGGRVSTVYKCYFDGREPERITDPEWGHSFLHGWSPDGKTYVYCAFRDMTHGADIYAYTPGEKEVQLTNAEGLNDGPEYDCKGEYIYFNSVRTGLMQAWRMKADGSEQTQLTFDEEWNTWFPHISPDREKIVTVAYKKGDLLPGEHLPHKFVELRLMKADGSDVKTVVELFGGQGTINVNSWNPDSTEFAFVSYRLPDEAFED